MEMEVFSDRLYEVVDPDAELETSGEGFEKTEGPVWIKDEAALLFTDFGAEKIHRWHPKDGLSVYREESRRAVGMALDPDGRLVACEGVPRRVSRTEIDGEVVTVASHYQGRRLNSPNDVAVRSDGLICFTDPRSKYLTDEQELDYNGVFSVDASGEVRLLMDDFVWPNGLCFSPDERQLYVNDSRQQLIKVYEMAADGGVGEGTVYAELDPAFGKGSPDGMKTDSEGRVYVTGPGGVWILDAEGERLGILRTPIGVLNLGFGGEGGDDLFLTAQTTLFRVKTTIRAAV